MGTNFLRTYERKKSPFKATSKRMNCWHTIYMKLPHTSLLLELTLTRAPLLHKCVYTVQHRYTSSIAPHSAESIFFPSLLLLYIRGRVRLRFRLRRAPFLLPPPLLLVISRAKRRPKEGGRRKLTVHASFSFAAQVGKTLFSLFALGYV